MGTGAEGPESNKFQNGDSDPASLDESTRQRSSNLRHSGQHEREGYVPNRDPEDSPEISVQQPASFLGSFSFPFLFISSLTKFGIYVHKLYQDSHAVQNYYEKQDYSYLIVSALALAAPAFLYITYLLASRFAKAIRPSCGDWFTSLVNGLLLIPWQIKSRADVLQFTSQRLCARRQPTSEESESVETLNRQASVLEFFEEFYAGLIHLVLQLYIQVLTLVSSETQLPLIGQLVGSGLALISTVRAVRRRDDGILTGVLSTVGWLSFFASRSMAISMAASIIHKWICFACAIHVVAMSVWITSVAWKSHQAPTEEGLTRDPLPARRKISIFLLVCAMFGIPSLVYWPIMFQLKERNRPLIFVLVCAVENAACFVVWFFGRGTDKLFQIDDYICVGVLFGGLLLGGLFVVLYSLCKPKYTDEVVMHNVKVQNANSYGIFYDFCDATFNLPKTDRIHRNLQRIRNME